MDLTLVIDLHITRICTFFTASVEYIGFKLILYAWVRDKVNASCVRTRIVTRFSTRVFTPSQLFIFQQILDLNLRKEKEKMINKVYDMKFVNIRY